MGEARVVGEITRLRRSSLWPTSLAPRGDGRPLLLVGGFGAPPATVTPLARWLRSGGWDVQVADLGWNLGCGEAAVARLEAAIHEAFRSHGGPVSLVGHSRGGLLGRVAAVRAGDEVDTLVTVCTPWALGPPDRPGVEVVARAIRLARRHGYRGLGSMECATGPCCATFRTEMHEKPSARWTLIWSHADRIAGDDWRAAGPNVTVDVGTSHLGSVLSEPGWTAIGDALSGGR